MEIRPETGFVFQLTFHYLYVEEKANNILIY